MKFSLIFKFKSKRSTIRIRSGTKYVNNHEGGFIHLSEINSIEEGIDGNVDLEWKIECIDYSAQIEQIENPLKVSC